jgi:hypothetical protein
VKLIVMVAAFIGLILLFVWGINMLNEPQNVTPPRSGTARPATTDRSAELPPAVTSTDVTTVAPKLPPEAESPRIGNVVSGQAATAASESPPAGGAALQVGNVESGQGAALPALAKPYEIDFSKGWKLLDDVQDGTYSLNEPALFFVLQQCQKLPREDFAPDPSGKETSVMQLLKTPDAYRGQPVTLSGYVGIIPPPWKIPVAKIVGIETAYELEMYETKGGSISPVATVILIDNPDLPKKLPRGTPVTVKGYFYKIRAYEKADKVGDVYKYECPVVIGKYVVPHFLPPGGVASGSSLGAGVVAFAGVVVFIFVFFLFLRKQMAARQGNLSLSEAVRRKRQQVVTASEIEKRVEFLAKQEAVKPEPVVDPLQDFYADEPPPQDKPDQPPQQGPTG